jgi:hypothetical protein
VYRISLDLLGFAFANPYRDSTTGRTLIADRVVPGRDSRRVIFRGYYLRNEQLDGSFDALTVKNAADRTDASGPDVLQQVSTCDFRHSFFRLRDYL